MIEFDLYRMLITAKGKRFLDVQATIEEGQFIALYGNSGAGKTTILRMLAGLMQPARGRIQAKENIWLDTEQKRFVRPQDRKVGMVFQDYALFPNMTVRENLKFALGKDQTGKIIPELIEMMELSQLQDRKPATLSGGQQQRVALARALVRRPQLLLLDEPLSALDVQMRARLQNYLQRIHREFSPSVILVSHDLPEIFKLAEKVWVLDNGRFLQKGTPQEVFAGLQDDVPKLVGEVVRQEMVDGMPRLQLLINNKLISVPIEKKQLTSYQPGQKVLLSPSGFSLKPLFIKE